MGITAFWGRMLLSIMFGMGLLLTPQWAQACFFFNQSVDLQALPAQTAPVKTQISLLATPHGFTNGEYQFWCYSYQTRSLTPLTKKYQKSQTCHWKPKDAGRYKLIVRSRRAGSKLPFQYLDTLEYLVTERVLPAWTVALQVDPPAGATINDTINLSATASNPTGVSYEFLVGSQGPDGIEWTSLRPSSSYSTITWTPARAGAYTVKVIAKKHGMVEAVDTEDITIAPIIDGSLGNQFSVAKFKGERVAAMSYTLDDGLASQVQYALPLFNKYAFHATIGLVGNAYRESRTDAPVPTPEGWNTASWEDWREALAQGHELANHSLNHLKPLTFVTDDAVLEREINGNWALIGEKTGAYPVSMVYPGNGYDERVRAVAQQRHVVERLDQLWYGQADDGTLFTAERANSLINYAYSEGLWVMPMLHGFAPGEYAYVEPAVLDEHLAFLQVREHLIWVETMGTVGRYVQERDTAKFALLASGVGMREFTVTTPLDDAIFDVPITVVLKTGADTEPSNVTATRNGEAIPFSVKAGKILLDVAPGDAPVTVRWQ